MKYDVFISYARKDFDEVKPFVDMLHKRIPALDCWFDITGIESGDEFEDKIIRAIDNSSYVIFALSENSLNSTWTKDEVIYARNTGKKVIPLLLKDASLEGWFLFKFGRIDCIDSTSETQVDKLLKDLAKWSGKSVTDVAGKIIDGQDGKENIVDAEPKKSPNADRKKNTLLIKLATFNNKGCLLSIAMLSLLLLVGIPFFIYNNSLTYNYKNYADKINHLGEDYEDYLDSVRRESERINQRVAESQRHIAAGNANPETEAAEKRRQAEAEAEKRRQAEAEAEKRRLEEAKKSNEFVSGKISGHDFVDLGLSVKWATCNVGASKPSDIGDYYAWGELKTKSEYTESNCTTYEQNIQNISGIAKYDVARVKFGAGWRMPTSSELEELVEKCEWIVAVVDNQSGFLAIGPNKNKIFFPRTGVKVYWDTDNETKLRFPYNGYYWSSTQCIQIEGAVYLNIYGSKEEEFCEPDIIGDSKSMGICVRPVAD